MRLFNLDTWMEFLSILIEPIALGWIDLKKYRQKLRPRVYIY